MNTWRHRRLALEIGARLGAARVNASVRAAVSRVRCDVPSEQSQSVQWPAVGEINKEFEASTEAVSDRLLELLPGLARRLRRDRRILAITLEQVWGSAFDEYDGVVYISYEQGARWASTKFDPTRPVVWATLLDLHARACCVASEVGALHRAGYPFGAEARNRTLHELAVVALVLEAADEEAALRYRDFEIIEHYNDASAYQRYAEELGRRPLPDADIEELRQRHDQVVERWGKIIKRPNGWAAALFPDRKGAPGTADLRSLAGLEHLRPFYHYGNHAVHGGPRASQIQRTDIDGTPQRTPGATVYADFAETAHGSLILLQQINASLMAERLKADDDVESLIAIGTLNRLVDRCGETFSHAADVARLRGWFTHRPE